MKILHISDTHSKHRLLELPKGDVLIHSGDFTFGGSERERHAFIQWFCELPYKHKIFIAGNHDSCMCGVEAIQELPENVYYLCNSSVTIEGVKFYGVPMFMEDILEEKYDCLFEKIPQDTDVLITHQPPYGILDGGDYKGQPYHYGNKILLNRVKQVKPRFHLFGHDHNVFGVTSEDGITFSNAAVVDEKYNFCRQANELDF